MKKKIVFVIGTRPEAIKLIPLIKKFQRDGSFHVFVCSTGQHREMLNQVFSFFNVVPDYEFNVMKKSQTLSSLTALLLEKCNDLFVIAKFDYVIVQGDTTTAFTAGLAAYYNRIKVIHIEAGLRTYDKYSPFPEEINRALLSKIADIHFCPTQFNYENLINEGIRENIHIVGNTVIDALILGLKMIENQELDKDFEIFDSVDFSKKIILLTSHRRENFGQPFENICGAINEIAEENSEVQIIYPVHLNPNILENAERLLTASNIHLLRPLDYKELIYIMNQSYFIMTDSGGIQEEAPSLKKPVLVLRDNSERMEGVANGNAKLVGTDKIAIKSTVEKLLKDRGYYESFLLMDNPYGDGNSSERILNIVKKQL